MEQTNVLKTNQANLRILHIQCSLFNYIYLLQRDVKREILNSKTEYIYNRLMGIISQKDKKTILIKLQHFLLEIKNFSGNNTEKRDLINECCNFFDRSHCKERSAALMIAERLFKMDFKKLNSILKKMWFSYSNENSEELEIRWEELTYFLENGELPKPDNIITPDNFEFEILDLAALIIAIYEQIKLKFESKIILENIVKLQAELLFITNEITRFTKENRENRKDTSEIERFTNEIIKGIKDIKIEYEPFFAKENELEKVRDSLEKLYTYESHIVLDKKPVI